MNYDNLIFRHYGANHLIKPFRHIGHDYVFNKFRGGLWGSPVGENFFTWEDWCKNEEFNLSSLNNYFDFKVDLKDVLIIDDPEQLVHPIVIPDLIIPSRMMINLLYIGEHYKGILLIHGKHYNIFHSLYGRSDSKYYRVLGLFNYWYCDSICIWDENIVSSL